MIVLWTKKNINLTKPVASSPDGSGFIKDDNPFSSNRNNINQSGPNNSISSGGSSGGSSAESNSNIVRQGGPRNGQISRKCVSECRFVCRLLYMFYKTHKIIMHGPFPAPLMVDVNMILIRNKKIIYKLYHLLT